MAKYFFIAFVFISINVVAQLNEPVKLNQDMTLIEDDSEVGIIEIESKYLTEDDVLNDILQFEGIGYLTIKLKGEFVNNKRYLITAKEIWNGEIDETSTVYVSDSTSSNHYQRNNNSELRFKVFSKQTGDNKIKITFRFDTFGITKYYDATKSDDYQLMCPQVILPGEMVEQLITTNEALPILVYALPHEKEGAKFWGNSKIYGNDVEKWGVEFGIKHYIVFEIEFME